MPSGRRDGRSPTRHGRTAETTAVLTAAAAAALLLAPAVATTAASDPLVGDQWALAAVGAPSAWATSRGEGVVVAVVDTGADLDHEDLAGQVAGTTSCIGSLGDPARCTGAGEDDDGHGTHVAGLVAAAADNGVGIAGVAPGARLLVVRALRRTCVPLPDGGSDCHGYGSTGDVSAAVRWAVDRGAHVVNLSWAEEAPGFLADGAVADALAYAWDRGVIVVMAAGNDGTTTDGLPRQPLPAVVVTATTSDGRRADYANGVDARARWALAAPGGDGSGACPAGDVLSTFTPPGGDAGYACLAGTSMAVPHVAGAAALLRSLGLTAQETVDRLVATARDLGPAGADPEFGAGSVDAAAAVAGLTRRPGGPDAAPGDGGGGAAAAPPAPDRAGADRPGPSAAPPSAPTPTPSPVAPLPTTGDPTAVAPPPPGVALPGRPPAGSAGVDRRPWVVAAVSLAALAGLGVSVAGARVPLRTRRPG